MNLEDVERYLVQKTLLRFDGNVSQAVRCARAEQKWTLSPHAEVRTFRMNKLFHERHMLLLALVAGLPGSLAGIILLWIGYNAGTYRALTCWTLTLVIVGVWLGFAVSVKNKVAFPLQTLSIAAMRRRFLHSRTRQPHLLMRWAVIREVNALGVTLREQRLGAVEATTLLRKVVEEIDVAMFTFDGTQHLRVVVARRKD